MRAHGANVDEMRANERLQADLFEAFVGALCASPAHGEAFAANWL